MLIGIEGELGGGKTILLVKFLKEEQQKGRKIYTNLTLNNIDYTPIDIMEFLTNNPELNNAVLGIDELTVYVDCRLSMSKANRFFSYLVLQSRKRNVDIYFTTQNMDMIDKRIVEHTLIQIMCEKIHVENMDSDNIRKYTFFDFRHIRKPKIIRKYLDISYYYPYYDTNQIITPLYEDVKPKSK